MRKRIFGRRLKRDTNERKALFRSLASAVILEERIQTTEQKAKAIKSSVEKMITRARDEGKKVEVALSGQLNAAALKKLIVDVAPRFEGRAGGYTRIIRLGQRKTDSASLVYLELVELPKAVSVQASVKKEETKKSSEPKKTPAKKRATKKRTTR